VCQARTGNNPEEKRFQVEPDEKRLKKTEQLDGPYLLRANRDDLTAEEAWRIYNLLTRAENTFRETWDGSSKVVNLWKRGKEGRCKEKRKCYDFLGIGHTKYRMKKIALTFLYSTFHTFRTLPLKSAVKGKRK
jgi:hypothetical protein